MITINKIDINNESALILIENKGSIINFRKFLKLLHNKKFVLALKNVLISIDYDFYFESCVVEDFGDTFIIVIVKTVFNNELELDTKTFSEHFIKSLGNVVSFMSKSGNILICPNPVKNKNFNHFKNFLKSAPDDVIFDFFLILSTESEKFLIQNKIIFLKTHGHAINYFHFRIQRDDSLYVFKKITNKNDLNKFIKQYK